ncbi:MAG: hypothetical protein U0487_01660 [Patescibacteria group bacterium]
MSDGRQNGKRLCSISSKEHVDQYSGWLTLEGDLLSLAEGIISEMPNMCEESAKALISQYKRQHDHDRDLAHLALIEFGLRSMADP